MAAKPVYLTPEGKKKLEEELHYLRTVRRQEVAAAIQSAKEEGDLSENAAYDEAKLEQGFLEGRIQTLDAQLQEAIIIQTGNGNSNPDVVHIGDAVTILEEDEDEDDAETYQIVGLAEADPAEGRISNESPLGRALLGKKLGQTVTVETPSGDINFKIMKITA